MLKMLFPLEITCEIYLIYYLLDTKQAKVRIEPRLETASTHYLPLLHNGLKIKCKKKNIFRPLPLTIVFIHRENRMMWVVSR